MKIVVAGIAVAAITAIIVAATAAPQERTISSYSTSLRGRTASQRHNALLAAHRLDGATIEPGQTFSFNQRIGTYSMDAGYVKAPVSYNGNLLKDWGGGVCQTSTTLYNAALLAGCPIVERFHHRFAPSYVDPGRDAAVAFPGIDLRFKNTLKSPIRVSAHVNNDRLEVSLKSLSDPAEKSEIRTQISVMRDPQTLRIPLSSRSQGIRAAGHAGFEVDVLRITGNRRELVSHDSYPVMDRVVGIPMR